MCLCGVGEDFLAKIVVVDAVGLASCNTLARIKTQRAADTRVPSASRQPAPGRRGQREQDYTEQLKRRALPQLE